MKWPSAGRTLITHRGKTYVAVYGRVRASALERTCFDCGGAIRTTEDYLTEMHDGPEATRYLTGECIACGIKRGNLVLKETP